MRIVYRERTSKSEDSAFSRDKGVSGSGRGGRYKAGEDPAEYKCHHMMMEESEDSGS